jgi:hypothetical protein
MSHRSQKPRSFSRSESRCSVSRAETVKDSTQEGPGVIEVSQLTDKFQTGSVRSLSRRREQANGTCSGDTGHDEVASMIEAGEVSTAQECLVVECNGVAVLVDITESQATVNSHQECTAHECQRK